MTPSGVFKVQSNVQLFRDLIRIFCSYFHHCSTYKKSCFVNKQPLTVASYMFLLETINTVYEVKVPFKLLLLKAKSQPAWNPVYWISCLELVYINFVTMKNNTQSLLSVTKPSLFFPHGSLRLLAGGFASNGSHLSLSNSLLPKMEVLEVSGTKLYIARH